MSQIQQNREAYEKLRDKLESEHLGRYALMHDTVPTHTSYLKHV